MSKRSDSELAWRRAKRWQSEQGGDASANQGSIAPQFVPEEGSDGKPAQGLIEDVLPVEGTPNMKAQLQTAGNASTVATPASQSQIAISPIPGDSSTIVVGSGETIVLAGTGGRNINVLQDGICQLAPAIGNTNPDTEMAGTVIVNPRGQFYVLPQARAMSDKIHIASSPLLSPSSEPTNVQTRMYGVDQRGLLFIEREGILQVGKLELDPGTLVYAYLGQGNPTDAVVAPYACRVFHCLDSERSHVRITAEPGCVTFVSGGPNTTVFMDRHSFVVCTRQVHVETAEAAWFEKHRPPLAGSDEVVTSVTVTVEGSARSTQPDNVNNSTQQITLEEGTVYRCDDVLDFTERWETAGFCIDPRTVILSLETAISKCEGEKPQGHKPAYVAAARPMLLSAGVLSNKTSGLNHRAPAPPSPAPSAPSALSPVRSAATPRPWQGDVEASRSGVIRSPRVSEVADFSDRATPATALQSAAIVVDSSDEGAPLPGTTTPATVLKLEAPAINSLAECTVLRGPTIPAVVLQSAAHAVENTVAPRRVVIEICPGSNSKEAPFEPRSHLRNIHYKVPATGCIRAKGASNLVEVLADATVCLVPASDAAEVLLHPGATLIECEGCDWNKVKQV